MLLVNKTAVIFGAAGSLGSAVSEAFGLHGARLFLSGRSLKPVARLAEKLRQKDVTAEGHEVDALDEKAVDRFIKYVARSAGRIDLAFNASAWVTCRASH